MIDIQLIDEKGPNRIFIQVCEKSLQDFKVRRKDQLKFLCNNQIFLGIISIVLLLVFSEFPVLLAFVLFPYQLFPGKRDSVTGNYL